MAASRACISASRDARSSSPGPGPDARRGRAHAQADPHEQHARAAGPRLEDDPPERGLGLLEGSRAEAVVRPEGHDEDVRPELEDSGQPREALRGGVAAHPCVDDADGAPARGEGARDERRVGLLLRQPPAGGEAVAEEGHERPLPRRARRPGGGDDRRREEGAQARPARGEAPEHPSFLSATLRFRPAEPAVVDCASRRARRRPIPRTTTSGGTRCDLPFPCSAARPGRCSRRRRAERLAVPYEMFRLPNGLTVIVHEDHSAPIVSVNCWYHVGSGRETPGRTGFAHLFEHLMFEGSKNVPEGAFDRWLEAVGGDNNGSTNERPHQLLGERAGERARDAALPRVRPHGLPARRDEPARRSTASATS